MFGWALGLAFSLAVSLSGALTVVYSEGVANRFTGKYHNSRGSKPNVKLSTFR